MPSWFYALGIVGYLAAPVAEEAGLPKPLVMSGLLPLVVGAVWLSIRQIRRRLES
ncbi:DUF3422 family protein [Pseudoroseicyclus tamaricis]|uniref:DUF3422 domain-containing protein n=1 Tax=Pseudoroseicyclus tamaricis TaxID=2705421 RepID=A0A6B2JRV8_9RHOB|nr:DUF3422 family protein [Pseudoroseicyclus tamaricis]NDV00720.1 DUF3422 domain-containing protein [Pseudoroseicyclus tamaricis]